MLNQVNLSNRTLHQLKNNILLVQSTTRGQRPPSLIFLSKNKELNYCWDKTSETKIKHSSTTSQERRFEATNTN